MSGAQFFLWLPGWPCEFCPRIRCSELPIHFGSPVGAVLLPCRNLGLHGFPVRDAAIKALTAQHAPFNFGDVRPASVIPGWVDFWPFRQPPRGFGCKRLVWQCGETRVQVVHQHHEFFGRQGSVRRACPGPRPPNISASAVRGSRHGAVGRSAGGSASRNTCETLLRTYSCSTGNARPGAAGTGWTPSPASCRPVSSMQITGESGACGRWQTFSPSFMAATKTAFCFGRMRQYCFKCGGIRFLQQPVDRVEGDARSRQCPVPPPVPSEASPSSASVLWALRNQPAKGVALRRQRRSGSRATASAALCDTAPLQTPAPQTAAPPSPPCARNTQRLLQPAPLVQALPIAPRSRSSKMRTRRKTFAPVSLERVNLSKFTAFFRGQRDPSLRMIHREFLLDWILKTFHARQKQTGLGRRAIRQGSGRCRPQE